MEQYKAKLKLTQRIFSVAALLLACCSLLFLLSECGLVNIAPVGGDSHWQSRWRGFVCGAGCGVAGLMLVYLLRISKALRSPEGLKKMYIQDHDERQIQIWTAARASAPQIFLLASLVAMVIAGYFSMTVGVTILVCVLVHSLVALGCKLYFSRKF